MSFRTKFIFFAAISFLVVAGIILAIVFRPKQQSVEQAQEVAPSAIANQATVVSPVPAAPEVKKPLTKAELAAAQKELAIKNQARIFTERFGSYSPGANFANFDELKIMVTPSTAAWLDQYKKQLVEKQATDFLGVTTKVISQNIIASDDQRASVMVSTQRSETLTNESNVRARDMLVKLVWQNNQWLVDGAYWQ